MDHEAAAPLVAELAAGRTARPHEGEVRAHVAICPECARVLETAERLRGQLRDHGGALFTSHPDADSLAAYALAASELPTARLAGIGMHVRACPACSAEVSEARAAHREPALRMWLAVLEARLSRPWLAPALAAALVLLLVPAYLGIFELPRARRGQRATAPAEPRPAPTAPAPPVEGAIASLLLTSGTRGVERPLPTVRVAPNAGAFALLVATEPTSLPTTGTLAATLADPQGVVAWRATFDAASAWDPGRHVVTLIVPTAGLHAGGWTLRLTAPGASGPDFEARFILANSRPSTNP